MATREENNILKYIASEGSITRFECEAVDVNIHTFLDCVAALKFRGWIVTEQKERKTESGRDMIINVYKFSQLFDTQKEKYLNYII